MERKFVFLKFGKYYRVMLPQEYLQGHEREFRMVEFRERKLERLSSG